MEIQILKCMHPRNMLTSTWAMYQSIAKSERVRVEVEKENPILMICLPGDCNLRELLLGLSALMKDECFSPRVKDFKR